MTLKKSIAAILLLTVLFSCKKESTTSNNTGGSNNPGGNNSSAPVANFTYVFAGISTAPATVNFTNTSTNSTTCTWDFGDNTTSSVLNPSHIYTQGGVYTVTLIANGTSSLNSTSVVITVLSPAGVTALKIPTTSGSGSTVSLFKSKNAWDQFVNGTGSAYQTATTVSDGSATFTNIPVGQYWWYVSNGCKNSFYDSVLTAGTVYANVTSTYLTVSLKGTATILINNTNNFITANIYVDSKFAYTLPAGYQLTVKYQEADVVHYIVAKEVIAGSEVNITQSKPVTVPCGGTGTVNMNP